MGKNKPKGGALGGFDQLRAPDAPTISVTVASEQISVAFTNPSDVGGGAITSYTATATASGVSTGATSATSPVTITGLTNGTSYSVTGLANNAFGASSYSDASSSTPALLTRGLFAGGNQHGTFTIVNVVDFIDITTTGNATDFGDLSSAAQWCGGLSSNTRGCISLGAVASDNSGNSDTIEYFTIASTGNATDFGNFSDDDRGGTAGLSNNTRGIFGGGQDNSFNRRSEMLYITIASTGNTTSFGELTPGAAARMGGCASTTRGVYGGGSIASGSGHQDVIQYVTIASTGNGTDFGNLTYSRQLLASCSSSTRGLFAGGNPDTNIIDYITIASTGNATDFGDLLTAGNSRAACSSSVRGVVGGGDNGAYINVIQYVTIGSAGNATDFGDLTVARARLAACSSAHGGIA